MRRCDKWGSAQLTRLDCVDRSRSVRTALFHNTVHLGPLGMDQASNNGLCTRASLHRAPNCRFLAVPLLTFRKDWYGSPSPSTIGRVQTSA